MCPNAGSDVTVDKTLKYQNSRCVVENTKCAAFVEICSPYNEFYILQEVKAYVLRVLLIISLSIIIAAGLYLLWKGIFWLSDWMNEMEEQRARQRHPRGATL